ncbi:hypothetical protein [Calothrix sp. PCC 7507]|uniref:hypothetical protein n=1 Tax=Calothrix sp. PCC 7507 TaxID=99598 RepID=UPI0002E3DB5F|nr:hypothetical protein [Calothrix sp. PCC 7507]
MNHQNNSINQVQFRKLGDRSNERSQSKFTSGHLLGFKGSNHLRYNCVEDIN